MYFGFCWEGRWEGNKIEHLSQYLSLCQDGWGMDKSGVYALSTEPGNMDSAQQTYLSQQILSQLTNREF